MIERETDSIDQPSDITESENLEGALAAVRSGAKYAHWSKLIHDSPPGDWYVNTEIICKDQQAANALTEPENNKSFSRADDVEGYPVVKISGTTSLCNREVRRPSKEEVEFERDSLQPELKRRSRYMTMLLAREAIK